MMKIVIADWRYEMRFKSNYLSNNIVPSSILRGKYISNWQRINCRRDSVVLFSELSLFEDSEDSSIFLVPIFG